MGNIGLKRRGRIQPIKRSTAVSVFAGSRDRLQVGGGGGMRRKSIDDQWKSRKDEPFFTPCFLSFVILAFIQTFSYGYFPIPSKFSYIGRVSLKIILIYILNLVITSPCWESSLFL